MQAYQDIDGMARSALKRYFGYDTFRPGQEQLVRAILSGRDAIGIMPTGAGKSICYQVPALVMSGITLVISPLVSLMGDQVRALKAAGARPAYLNSSLTPAQQNTVLKRASEGQYQIMYVAPERLEDPRFLAFAQAAAAPGGIGVPLVAVDEAHCVSQWGQDFRPSYLRISGFIQALPVRPVLAAFTATATERVRTDILGALGLQRPEFVAGGFDRPNLYFSVEELGDKAKTAWIRDYVLAHGRESGIVYCATRKSVDALAEELARALGPGGIRVGRYHAGMGAEERRQNQAAFIDDEMPVMVATNAFGMGIDKPNVRYVIHNNVPESIEAYYQEAGRAGRDGDPASCHLLWNGNDFRLRRFLIDRDPSEAGEGAPADGDDEARELARQNRYRLLSQMEGYCQTSSCLRAYILRYFGDEAGAARVEAGAQAADGAGFGQAAASHASGCANCSNCLTTFEVEDVTDIARQVVRMVATRPGRFGKTMIADMLHGANTERIRSLHLNEATGYAALEHVPSAQIKDVIDQLAGCGYLTVSPGQYPVLALGPRAGEALGEREGAPAFSFSYKRRSAKRAGSARARRAVDLLRDEAELDARPRVGDDAELFERLRERRTELARERQLPPYMICNDKALRGMCRRRPQNRDELLDVPGIGERKADEFGELFLTEIASFEAEQG